MPRSYGTDVDRYLPLFLLLLLLVPLQPPRRLSHRPSQVGVALPLLGTLSQHLLTMLFPMMITALPRNFMPMHCLVMDATWSITNAVPPSRK